MIPFRSPIFVPGNRRNMLEKAVGFDADFVVPDLEDSVPRQEKENARQVVSEMVPILAERQRVIVRINSLETGLTRGDLEAVVSPHIYGLSIGKVESPHQVKEYDSMVSSLEVKRGIEPGKIKLVFWLENARAILRAYDIATASPRVVGVVFGAEDYTRDMGIQRTESGEELYFPRACIGVAARAARVVALDTPYVKFRDLEGLERDVRAVLKLGFKGKFAIHPAQLEPLNRLFGPQPEEVEKARKIVQAWDAAAAEGRGAVEVDGQAVDVPVVERARDLLAYAEAIAKRGKEK